jgi:tripartite-type tricarboxylate transporter receptor subunit TctC
MRCSIPSRRCVTANDSPSSRNVRSGIFRAQLVGLRRPLVGDGTTRGLAVLTPKRIDSLPDVATMTEAGFGQMQSGTWFGMLTPAGTPVAAIAWVNRETKNAFAPEQMRQRYLSQDTALPLGSPDDFAAHIAAERERWGEVIRKANIKLSN